MSIYEKYKKNDLIIFRSNKTPFRKEELGRIIKYSDEYKYYCMVEFNNKIRQVGKFYINPFGEEMILPEIYTPGNMIIFPSWFFHKVTPVTKGKRISITIWSKGPKFR